MNTLRAFGSRITVLVTLLGCVSVGVSSAGAALAQPQYITLPGDQSGVAVARSGFVFANETNGAVDLWYKAFGGNALAVDASPQSQLSAACSGDTVVYVDKVDATGDPTGETNRIMVLDLATRKRGVVSDSAGLKGNPSIHGNTVVWGEGSTGQGDVMTANLDADADGVKDFLELVPLSRSVCTTVVGGPGEQREPRISAAGLVWVQYEGTTATAVKRRSVPTNLATEETLSGDTGSKKPSPDISGDLVVWQQVVGAEHRIAVRRISTGVTSYVGGSGGNLGPVTDGERVAWISLPTGVPPQVMMSSGGQTLLVSPSTREQASPRFGDDQLAWEEDMLPGDGTNLDIAYVSLASSKSATALISAKPSTTVNYGADYSFTGRLESQTAPLSGMRIDLEKSTDGSTFLPVPASATTATDGTFTFGGLRSTSKTWYRAVFSGTTEYASAASGAVCVSVRPRVGQPIGPRTMSRGRNTTYSGYLMPRHSPGTHPVRIYRYLYVAGAWKYSGYSVAIATHGSSGDRYSARVALPTAGKWRLRSYAPSDDAHAAAWSRGYTSVTVK